MKQYETTGIVNINPGARLQLSKAQAADRIHKLTDLGKGVYEVTGRVQFKVGEKFGYDGELPRTMANLVQEEGSGGNSGNSGPTVKELQEKLKDLGVNIPANAKKAKLEELLAEAEKAAAEKAKADTLTAKALELSGKDADAFGALPQAEQDQWLAKAREALGQQ